MRTLVFLIAILVSWPASAESWKLVYEDNSAGRIFADLDSVRSDGGFRYLAARQEKSDHHIVLTLNKIDCDQHQLSILKATEYDASDSVLDDEDFTQASAPPTVGITPGSGFEALAKMVCQ